MASKSGLICSGRPIFLYIRKIGLTEQLFMNPKILFRISLFLTAIFCSCKEPVQNQDVYYLKYEINSNASPYVGVKLNVEYTNELGKIVQITVPTGKWETTVGPFKKGSSVSLSAVKYNWSGGTEYHLKMDLHVHQSVNNSPFALKASDAKTSARAKASLTYSLK